MIQEMAKQFHKLIRMHSKAQKVSLRTRVNLEARKARSECAKSLWRFAAKILDDEGSNNVTPAFNSQTAETFFTNTYSSNTKSFQRPEWLPEPPAPANVFDEEPIVTLEVLQVIKNTRSSSPPSPIDQVSYRVLKNCPSLLATLTDLYNSCWESATIPTLWKQGVVRLIPKEAAMTKPEEPGNFRPIALTSCVGKVFTSILKNRWMEYMLSNHFLNTNIQKAFVRNIPGCTEQFHKLLSAIQESHQRHKSITVCWLDLANAYGSVHHGLIDFTLQHYLAPSRFRDDHAPSRFRDVVASLYSNLSAVVTSQSWATNPIPLQIGVYQGDPLSVVIFNSVMATLADTINQQQHLGYKFSNSSRSTNILQYADDTCLIADGPSSCQQLLNCVERWLQWSGMRAEVPKCHSLAIQASSGKTYDPSLVLQGEHIPSIGNNAIKFLGAFIQIPKNPNKSREDLQSKLTSLLDKVDTVPVTRNQKLLLYRAAICPRMLWDLGISDLPISWIKSCLEATATRYLKRWSGLARSADPSRLYLPKSNGSRP